VAGLVECRAAQENVKRSLSCRSQSLCLVSLTNDLRSNRPVFLLSTRIDFVSERASCSERALLALGLEGSANKLGAGIIKHNPDDSTIVLSNVRHTYITPPGEGFQPKDTALHHREWIFKVVKDAVKVAGVGLHEIDCICYTKGASIHCEFKYLDDLRGLQAPAWAHLCNLSRW
jgi:hypothetical protein